MYQTSTLHLLDREEEEQESAPPQPLQVPVEAAAETLAPLTPLGSEPQLSLKWDQLAGRAGDPPGLGLGPGSSQVHEVNDPFLIESTFDNLLFPPMDKELIEDVDSLLQSIGNGKTSTAVGEPGDQLDQQLQQQEQKDKPHPQPHKLDLLTGRAGDPPGLDHGPGSSHTAKVNCNSIEPSDDPHFPPMDEEDLDWFDAMQKQLAVTAGEGQDENKDDEEPQPNQARAEENPWARRDHGNNLENSLLELY